MKKLSVILGDTGIEVGTLHFDVQGSRQSSAFIYSQAWRSNPQAFALSPTMPLSQENYFSTRDGKTPAFPLPIADSCPDSWGERVIKRSLRSTGHTGRLTDYDMLVNVDDYARIGALRYRDETGSYLAEPIIREGGLRAPPLLDLKDLARAARATELDRETAAEIALLRHPAGSLGGARPKATIRDEDNNRLLIAKFTGAREGKPTERAEVMTLRLADSLGLRASKAEIAAFSPDEPIALIERFDRSKNNARHHYISAQTFMGAASAEGSHTYTEIADAMRMYADNPRREMNELFRRVAYSILVSNGDDHLKNHGFLYCRDGRWNLSPMFDVNPDPERSAYDFFLKTWISEASGDEASITALIDASERFEVSRDQATSLIGQMAHDIKNRWQSFARDAGMTPDQIKSYRPAFDHNQSELALSLTNKTVSLSNNSTYKKEDDDELDDEGPSFSP